jgi:hypothetical protein
MLIAPLDFVPCIFPLRQYDGAFQETPENFIVH